MTQNHQEQLERALRSLHQWRRYGALSMDDAAAIYRTIAPKPIPHSRISELVQFATGRTNIPFERHQGLLEWSQKFPVAAMRKLGFELPDGQSDSKALLAFFGASSPDEVSSRLTAEVAFRQAQGAAVDQPAVAAWIREAELVASQIPFHPFDEAQLRESIDGLRLATRGRIDNSLSTVQAICADAGVAFVIVPELPATRISGCARWLDDGRPMIGLTIRYKTDDQLWFTFFHELGHVILHHDRLSFVIDNGEVTESAEADPQMIAMEEEANRFARETLVPKNELEDFVGNGDLSSEAIYTFAERLGISPGILVGRLQHDSVLDFHQGNRFKQKLAMQPDPESQRP